MSLNYDLSRVPESVWRLPDGSLNPRTEELIFATMLAGIGKITRHSAREVCARLRVAGAPIPLEVILKHVGLHTNVRRETDRQFVTRVFLGRLQSARYDVSRE